MIQEQKRDWIGFDDRLFMWVGMPLLALITNHLFNSSYYNTIDFFISFFVSLLFTICNWLLMRWVMIQLRKRFPSMADTVKRNLLFLVSIIAVVLMINFIGNYLLSLAFGPQYNGADYTGILIIVLISIMTMSIYEAVYYFNQLKAYIIREEQTRQMVVESKLDALRNQARPHFLFNSLNTLRDVIENDPEDKATAFVDQLADVYRFILDTGQANLVTVEQEIAFAKSYLYIQSERFGENLQVTWDIPQEALQQSIMPMTLQLLLENAIKHNVVSKAKPLTIEISYHAGAIQVKNNLQLKSTQMPSTKLGLDNIKKRYQLIGDHLPTVTQTTSEFLVTIPLQNVS